jgi:hypothetical protein
VKRIVLLFAIAVAGLSAAASNAHAQRSGSLQVSARVVDSRESWSGLQSVQTTAAQLIAQRQTAATVATSFSQISVVMEPAALSSKELERPRRGYVTINYLRN